MAVETQLAPTTNGISTPAYDDVGSETPISIPDSPDTGESGKLKMIMQLIKKCLGVADIASMRLSLPASLMEPVPNLEYWNYVDRPDIFAAINDSPDPFERMLAVLRFTFSKDLKFIRGKICKPYNSVLGEHFRCQWKALALPNPPEPEFVPRSYLHIPTPAPVSESGSVRSFTSFYSGKKPDPDVIASRLAAVKLDGNGDVKAENGDAAGEEVRVIFITEQVSHHPPKSSFYYEVVDRGIQASGVDQISARLSGTTVRIAPGSSNKGIFINLVSGFGEGEEYQITHPIAGVNGLLTGRLNPIIGDSVIITCRGGKEGQKLRAIIEYKDDSWIGRPARAIEGLIHTYEEDSDEHEAWRKCKQVPPAKVLATFQGAWNGKIEWKRADDSESRPLIDLSKLSVVPKLVRPLSDQLPDESRRFWETVTQNLLRKDFNEATKNKLKIEQRQRDIAAERREQGVHFTPVYFDPDISTGRSTLSEAGRQAIQDEIARIPTS